MIMMMMMIQIHSGHNTVFNTNFWLIYPLGNQFGLFGFPFYLTLITP